MKRAILVDLKSPSPLSILSINKSLHILAPPSTVPSGGRYGFVEQAVIKTHP